LSNQVIVLESNKMKEMMQHYASFKVVRKASGVVFAAKLPDTAITAYSSGKVLFQGAGANREALRWGPVVEKKSKTPVTAKGDSLPPSFENLSVLGSDETGTGDYFGPVTVAACFVRANQIELVKELGVKDSKALTDDYMRKIAPDLEATLIHSVLMLPNEKYNDIQGQGFSQGKIKALLHNQALKHVLRKMYGEKPEYILIDQFAQRGIYYNHIKSEPEIIKENVLFSTKAEGLHVSVAAASIIARVAFLEEMDRLSNVAGIALPKGAGPKVDEVAARILLNQGESTLKTLTKWHFANSNKARNIAQKKRL
jgi:ribonuclease HIII